MTLQLNFKHEGEGPSLLLIHGLFGSLENLGVLFRELVEDFSVYSIDLPEHGRSPHHAETSLPALCEQVKTWLDQQGIERIAVVGHSLGGKVAMELAMHFPELVSKLAVLDIAPVDYPPHHNEIFSGLRAIDPSALKTRGEADALMKDAVPEAPVRSFLLKNLAKGPEGYHWRMNLEVLYRDYAKLIQGNSSGNPCCARF